MADGKHEEAINYELLVEDSLRTVVRSALAIVVHERLPGDAHFYISFKTPYAVPSSNPPIFILGITVFLVLYKFCDFFFYFYSL